MKKIIFGLMMIIGVVMFTSCDPNAGTNDYDDETIVTPTDPEENVSTETLSFVKNSNGDYILNVEVYNISITNNSFNYNNENNESIKVNIDKINIIDGITTNDVSNYIEFENGKVKLNVNFSIIKAYLKLTSETYNKYTVYIEK